MNEEINNIDSDELENNTEIEQELNTSEFKNALDDVAGGRPYHFIEGIANAKLIIANLNTKVDRIKASAGETLDNEIRGILEDFIIESEKLNDEFVKLDGFFDNSLSKKELNFINKLSLINKELESAYSKLAALDWEQNIEELTKSIETSTDLKNRLNDFVNESKNEIDTFDNNLKTQFSNRLGALKEILDEFVETRSKMQDEFLKKSNDILESNISHQKESLDAIDSSFMKISAFSKKFFLSSLGIMAILGIMFGVFSILAFYKYKEYKNIESKFDELSNRLNSVKILKDQRNNLLLYVPTSAQIQNTSKEYIINLGGGK